jgi:hypothetical protein
LAPKVIDPVGDRLADLGVGEVMDVDLVGLAGGLPLPTAVREAPDQLLFLALPLLPWVWRSPSVPVSLA